MSSKARRRQLDAEWLRWLHLNIARGCNREELRETLRREGFEEGSIQAGFNSAPHHAPPPAVAAAAAASPGKPPPARLSIANLVRHGGDKAELYIADDFLSPGECAQIVELIGAALRPSTISSPVGAYDQGFRTSRTCDLADSEPAVAALNEKISRAIGFDHALAEYTQGQHYEVGQVFKTHTDFFKPYELERFSTESLGQRTWTFMIYLNEPEGGGETHFPDLDLKVTPKRGRAVIWNNLHPTGEGNQQTRHQSLPVTAGTKTIITKWFRMPRQKPAAYASQKIGWKQTL